MKFKKYYFLFVSLLIFALLGLLMCAQQKESGSKVQEEIIKKMVLKEGMKKDLKVIGPLVDKILSDNEELARHFKNRDFIAMAKIYKKRGGMIISPEYKKISGKDSAEFWQKVWEDGAELEINTVSVYLSNAIGKKDVEVCKTDKMGKTIEKKTFDAVAFVIHEFHIVQKAKEKGAHNQTGTASGAYGHQDVCQWEPEGDQ